MNADLPFYHKDPFDCIIISQSLAESIPIVTVDSAFSQYSITLDKPIALPSHPKPDVAKPLLYEHRAKIAIKS